MTDIINIAGLIKPSLPMQDFYRIMIVYVILKMHTEFRNLCY